MTPLYLSHAIEAVWPALANHVWQSTISVAVVALLTSLLRRYPARVSYSLWVIASIKFLVPFSLLVMIGGALPHPRYVSSQTAIYSAIDSAGRPFSAIPVAQAPSASRRAARRAPISDWLPAAFATMWLSGVVVVLLVWMARWRSISLVLRSATCADSGREATLLRELQSLAGAHKIDLLISDQLMEPGVFGILRPVIVWPAGLSERLDDQQLKAILAHELIHRTRLDNLTAALHMAVEAIFWFHPVVWWMERRLIEHREQACDEAVVRICNQPGSYAEGLLKACRFCIESPLACVAGITGADLNRRLQRIMTSRVERLSRSRMLIISSLGFVAVFTPVIFGLVRINPTYAQILHASGPRPSFDVATIKPGKSGETGNIMMGLRDGYFSAKHMSLRALVKAAYNVRLDDQLIGGPDWMNREYFDIEAKADPSMVKTINKLGAYQAIEQFDFMLQSLLEERYQLKVSTRMQDLPAYGLVVAKGGPKLKSVQVSPEVAASPTPPPPAPPPPPVNGAVPTLTEPQGDMYPGLRKTGPNQVTATGFRMSWLADWLLAQEDGENRVVVDQTGLKGNYDFVLNGISVNPSAVLGATPAPPDEQTISIFTALQEQLGLKLIPIKAPAEVLVIEHAERPSAN
jgi:bla regulator protein blaR1